VHADDRHVVPLTLLAQVGVTLGAGALSWLWKGQVAGVSAVLGGATAVVPNAFLAARILQGTALSASGMMRSAWLGEAGKILLTAVSFGVIFGFVRPLEPLAVFGGFIAAQLPIFGALLYGTAGARNREAMTKS
jgi:ATP synthase protein I